MSIESDSTFRDQDLRNLSQISTEINSTGMMDFIVTGSYSIEALTQQRIKHNDMDANVFVPDITIGKVNVKSIFARIVDRITPIEALKETPDRLEYTLVYDTAGNPVRRQLELSFMQIKKVTIKEPKLFTLYDESDIDIRVPTTLTNLHDSQSTVYTFRIKTLEYAIATWAIRISGALIQQKREVKQSDVDHFRALLSIASGDTDILKAMKYHPQMPVNLSAYDLLRQSRHVVSLTP